MTSFFTAMWRLVPVAVLLIAATLLVAATFARDAEEKPYCAYEVTVRSPSGVPVDKVPVILVRNHDTEIFQTTTDRYGVARFCDAPIETVDIAVGRDLWGQAWIRNVRFTWPTTFKAFITYAPPWTSSWDFDPQRTMLLRVMDENGLPLAGARFQGKLGKTTPAMSDALGRIFGSFQRGDKLEGRILKAGYAPAPVSEQPAENLEMKVVLHKQ